MNTRHWLLILLTIVPGVAGTVFFSYFALQDWAALRGAYAAFERLAHGSPTLAALFIAEARQNMHRINVLAEAVWALLCALLAAIGLHGLCVGSATEVDS